MIQEVISSVFSGLGVAITAIGGILLLKNKKEDDSEQRERDEKRQMRSDNKKLRDQAVINERYIYQLELIVARSNQDLPKRPTSLETGEIPIQPQNQQ